MTTTTKKPAPKRTTSKTAERHAAILEEQRLLDGCPDFPAVFTGVPRLRLEAALTTFAEVDSLEPSTLATVIADFLEAVAPLSSNTALFTSWVNSLEGADLYEGAIALMQKLTNHLGESTPSAD